MILTEFLLARIAEDEAAWGEAFASERDAAQADGGRPFVLPPLAMRLPAECEAKRRIVELHRSWDENTWQSPPYFSAPMDEVLAALALPYADHPDYDEAWRP